MKNIIISIHDASPKFEHELTQIFKKLEEMNIEKKEVFVVLNWEGKYPVGIDREFQKLIFKSFRHGKIELHGLTHYLDEKGLFENILFGKKHAGLGEFASSDYKSSLSRLSKAKKIFKKIFKVNPSAFIPARWTHSKGELDALKKVKINYTEDIMHMINLLNGEKVLSFAICYDYGDNKLLNLLSRYYNSILLFLSDIFRLPIRYSIHPNDITNGNFYFEIEKLNKLLRKGWIPTTTVDFWRDKNDRHN